jgi:hypothetical protein
MVKNKLAAYIERMQGRLEATQKEVQGSAKEIVAAGADLDKLSKALRKAPNLVQAEAYINVLGAFLESLQARRTTPQQLHQHCINHILRRSGSSMTASDQAELNVWAWVINDLDLQVYATENGGS